MTSNAVPEARGISHPGHPRPRQPTAKPGCRGPCSNVNAVSSSHHPLRPCLSSLVSVSSSLTLSPSLSAFRPVVDRSVSSLFLHCVSILKYPLIYFRPADWFQDAFFLVRFCPLFFPVARCCAAMQASV